ncbi:hypothetical protein D9756_006324 [Leucocoprinus leucothites]|uniref:Uncharacterized protein n=1 Tax=Leucocoprinus leucothites TaxID=201217 RepID=A0A8H5FXZ0_9AGAR|nr:hypothetical protein D9756_006324 [Leucoagaricus leucothites]
MLHVVRLVKYSEFHSSLTVEEPKCLDNIAINSHYTSSKAPSHVNPDATAPPAPASRPPLTGLALGSYPHYQQEDNLTPQIMPFFQGKYNFETHGGTFHDVRRHRYQRLHHRNSNQPASAPQPQPSTEQSPHLSESLRSHLPSVITHTDSVNSEKSIDEEAQTIPDSSSHLESMWGTLADKLPRLIHAQFLLHLPSHYFDRVDRLSRDGNMALKEILDMAVESNTKCGNDFQSQILDLGQSSSSLIMKPESLPPAYRTLTIRWGCFIDDLLAEWKTLNLVSALLVP